MLSVVRDPEKLVGASHSATEVQKGAANFGQIWGNGFADLVLLIHRQQPGELRMKPGADELQISQEPDSEVVAPSKDRIERTSCSKFFSDCW